MTTKTLSIISTFACLLIFGGMIILSLSDSPVNENQNNVSTVDGKQMIEIEAKGGYSPRKTLAKAKVPSVIKIKTMGTFDCSSALTIPGLNYQKFLPPSGETLIEIPPQKAGSALQGICSMGMYSFAINFS